MIGYIVIRLTQLLVALAMAGVIGVFIGIVIGCCIAAIVENERKRAGVRR